MPPLPTFKERRPPATLCLPSDPGTAPYVLPASGSPDTSITKEANPNCTSIPPRVAQDSPQYLPRARGTQPVLLTETGTDTSGSAPPTAQSATTGAPALQTPVPTWISASQNTMAPSPVTTNATHHGQAAKVGQAFETAHEEMAPFWLVAAAPRRDAQPPDHAVDDLFRRTCQYPGDGLDSRRAISTGGMPAPGTTAPTGNPSTGAKRKASDVLVPGTKRPRTHEAVSSTPRLGARAHPAVDRPGVGFANDSDPLSALTRSDAPTNASASNPVENLFLPEMDFLFADAPVDGALPMADMFSAAPVLQTTSVPLARSAQRALTPVQLIAAAKARLDNDALGGDLPLLLPGWTPSGAEADRDAAFARGSASGAVEITPETKRRIHEAEAEMLRALEIAPPKDSGPMEQRIIVCTYVDLVVFGGRPVMMSAHLDAQRNNTILPHRQLQVPQAGHSAYLEKIEAAKQGRAAKFQSTKRARATQLVQQLQYKDGHLLPFCKLCYAENPAGRLPRAFKNEDRLVIHYSEKHLD